MPKKAAGRRKARKSASKKAVRKSVKKKALKKKATKKKAAKKKAAKKKKATKKAAKKRAAAKKPQAARKPVPKKPTMVEPGPPPRVIPPVEEPAENEEAVATVTHYYSHLGVAVLQVNKGEIKTGDTIRFKGHTTNFTQQVESMEYEHQHIGQVAAGQSVGIKVKDHVREHDIVYLVK